MSEAVLPRIQLIRRVNVLTLLVVMICASVTSFLATSPFIQMGCTFVLFAVLAVFGYVKSGVKFLAVYLISYTWLSINTRYGINFPSPMMFSLIVEMVPLLMPAYLLMQTPSGKLTSGLRQLHIPPGILLTIIVILRFMPTIASEFSDVKDAMRTRGFLRSPRQIILHPLNTFEYALVPMVFRSLKIADELASSCIVRGIESPDKKQGYYTNRLTVGDAVFMGAVLTVTIVCVTLR
jgi:energy-coupling factor transport system permease protein